MSGAAPATHDFLHASAVALDGQAVLLLGPSGSGKSALALDMMSRGAGLIADDHTRVTLLDGVPVASAPARIRGWIEARGVGLLLAEYAGPHPVTLVVDLGTGDGQRLPARHQTRVLGVELELLYAAGLNNLGPMIIQYMKGGRVA